MVRVSILGVALAFCVLAAGCQQEGPAFDPETMMKAPPRAPELDKLDVLIGTWEGTFEMRFAGVDKAFTGKGTNVIAWEKDKWAIVERTEGTMGEKEKMLGLGVWAWDGAQKKYRLDWHDSWGMNGTGHATYDEVTKTFHIVTEGKDPASGKKTVGEGTTRLVDDGKTMEWNFAEWNASKTKKIMEMKGTSKRK